MHKLETRMWVVEVAAMLTRRRWQHWRWGDCNLDGVSQGSDLFCRISCVRWWKRVGLGAVFLFQRLKPRFPMLPVPGLLLFADPALSLPVGWCRDSGGSSCCW
jgi:hypothetical protein